VTLTKTAGWSLATALLCVVLLVAAWFLLIEPQRATAAETRTQTESVRQQNLQLAARIDQLRVEFANLPNRKAELLGIRQALPDVALLDRLLDEISTAALEAPVNLDSITTSEPVALVGETGAAPDTATGGATDAVTTSAAGAPTSGATGASTAAATPASGDSVAAGAAPGTPPAVVPGVAVLAAIPLSLSSTGDYFSIAAFLKTLQTVIDRALIIDTVSVDMATADGSTGAATDQVSVSITGRVFVFVDPDSVPSPTATIGTASTAIGGTS